MFPQYKCQSASILYRDEIAKSINSALAGIKTENLGQLLEFFNVFQQFKCQPAKYELCSILIGNLRREGYIAILSLYFLLDHCDNYTTALI